MKRNSALIAVLGVVTLVSVMYAQKVEKEGKAWLAKNTAAAEMNVNGVWKSPDWGPDWGEVTLIQAKGASEVTGTGDGWTINGVVSGKKTFASSAESVGAKVTASRLGAVKADVA